MEKSSDKAAFNSVMTNSTVRQKIKRLQKSKPGRTNKEKRILNFMMRVSKKGKFTSKQFCRVPYAW